MALDRHGQYFFHEYSSKQNIFKQLFFAISIPIFPFGFQFFLNIEINHLYHNTPSPSKASRFQ